MLPSVEENLRIKRDIWQAFFPSPGSTSPTSSENETLPSCSATTRTAFPTVEDTLFTQLNTLISNDSSESSSRTLNDLNPTPSTASTATDYDSDRTDFRTTPKSPCPTKRLNHLRRQTGTTSHYFGKAKVATKVLPVRRRLDFGPLSKATSQKLAQRPKQMVAPEYSPMHRWTNEEREYLVSIPIRSCQFHLTKSKRSAYYSVGFGEHPSTWLHSSIFASIQSSPCPRFGTNWKTTYAWY